MGYIDFKVGVVCVLVVFISNIIKVPLNFYWIFYSTKICKLIMYLDLSGISARIAFKYYFFLSSVSLVWNWN
jgi:hypothetical protein